MHPSERNHRRNAPSERNHTTPHHPPHTHTLHTTYTPRTFPQRTIYDALLENGNEFAMYYNDTPASADMFMEGVARHTERILPTSDFYAAAANGSLPEFSWVRP